MRYPQSPSMANRGGRLPGRRYARTPAPAAGAAAAWTPAEEDSNTLQWVDPSDAATVTESSGLVERVSDKSSHGSDWYQEIGSDQPSLTTINGRTALSFVQDAMYITGVALGDYVPSAAFFVTSNVSLGRIFGNVSVTNQHRTDISTGATYDIYSKIGTGEASSNGGALSATSQTMDTGLGTDAANDNLFYVQYNTSQIINALSRMRTGSWYYGTFDIGEIIILDVTPSEAVRQKYEGYLAHGWGLEDKLPVDHPYKSAPPTV